VPPRRRRLASLAVLVAGLVACEGEPGRRGASARGPDAEFLLAAGDSTFWVRSDSAGISVRRSPLLLARLDGRFHELYVADDDRSFFDAVLVGQRLYRRDLLTNDSVVVLDDPRIAAIARDYALAHPGERPLAPDDEASDDPHTVATIELELLDVFGHYASFAHHLDVDIVNGEDTHRSRRGVLDLQQGREAPLETLLGSDEARRVIAAGRIAFDATVDSILAASGSGARRAAAAIGDFRFDSSSFALVDGREGLAVSFFVPGAGARSGGITLPVPEIAVGEPAWWREQASTAPVADDGEDRWAGASYDVVARYDSSGQQFTLSLRSGRRDVVAGRYPAPAQRLYRLDQPPIDAGTRAALSRAFDEAALYSGETRTASAPMTSPRSRRSPDAALIPATLRQ
jgi:hypothetical protein